MPYTTGQQDMAATGFRQMDAVHVRDHGDQEFVILRVNIGDKTVKACKVTANGHPGKRNFTFPVADLTLVHRPGTY